MNRASKFGLTIMGIALLVWGVPFLNLHYPIPVPFSSPLPLSPRASLHRAFTIRGSETYFIFLKCREAGESKERWKNNTNSQELPAIPCNISVRILRDGREIHSEHLASLTQYMTSEGVDYWLLTHIRLSSSSGYELQLTNGTDLTYLQPTEPTIQIRLNDGFFENWIIIAGLGCLAGGALFLIGFVMFINGRLSERRPAIPSASIDGGVAS